MSATDQQLSLIVQGLGKRFSDGPIIGTRDFSVSSGSSIAFMAPSGTGKSTVLSMLGLLLKPSEGTIILNEARIDNLEDASLSRLRQNTFGFIFQHTQLIGSLRVLENVLVPASFNRAEGDHTARAKELLEAYGLEHRMNYYPYQLSVGQKRRVAAARAFLLEPPIIIADEPTNDLDSLTASIVADSLFSHVAKGGILLYATHDTSLASRADRIITLGESDNHLHLTDASQ